MSPAEIDAPLSLYTDVVRENWIDRITGSFQDDPEFDEILRLGREMRNTDPPDGE